MWSEIRSVSEIWKMTVYTNATRYTARKCCNSHIFQNAFDKKKEIFYRQSNNFEKFLLKRLSTYYTCKTKKVCISGTFVLNCSLSFTINELFFFQNLRSTEHNSVVCGATSTSLKPSYFVILQGTYRL